MIDHGACGPRVPVSSYRLQLHAGFNFESAATLASYLAGLGITECYCSPCTRARSGSTHGYDVCDYTQLSVELGGETAFRHLSEALRAHGLGLILDIVPNHMATDPDENPWWRDVLTYGAASRYGGFFDIDWASPDPELAGKVLLPVLSAELDEVIQTGEVHFQRDDRGLSIKYGDRSYPVAPARSSAVLSTAGRPDTSSNRESLRDALRDAPYRLAPWQRAFDTINYRRFFTISDLVGVRVEEPDVFDASHALVARLVGEGLVTGLRVDHPDGLWDPSAYFERLQASMGHAAGVEMVYLVAEKILSVGERLRSRWPIHGTTGYNFLNDLNGLFVDLAGADALVGVWRRRTGRSATFADELRTSKTQIVSRYMSSELDALTRHFVALAALDGTTRIARDELRQSLVTAIAVFPVYRTYLSERATEDADRQAIGTVSTAARPWASSVAALTCLEQVLLGEGVWSDHHLDEVWRNRRRTFVARFQQLTGPVQAKGLEDTTFYRFPVLLSVNEVGGDPETPARSVAEFHQANLRRLEHWPLEMITTATHDTKRGEDARARLNVLSEIPDEWERAVSEWWRLNTPHRTMLDSGIAPSPDAEYLFYQSLLGAWPSETDVDIATRAPDELVDRLREYMDKATKEAKHRTSWIAPDPRYDQAVSRFVEMTLQGPGAAGFLESFIPFERRVARAGIVNALAQTLLKITSPGVPDFYQGAELWDFSLVDPDNRRPIDFARRREWLDTLAPSLAAIDALTQGGAPATGGDPFLMETLGELFGTWWDGRLKLWLTSAGLRLRRRYAALFLRGRYVPLEVEGAAARHVVAYARADGQRTALVVVPRFAASFVTGDTPWPPGERCWADTRIRLPSDMPVSYVHLFTAAPVEATSADASHLLAAADCLAALPFAVLWAR